MGVTGGFLVSGRAGFQNALQTLVVVAGLFCFWRYMAIAVDVHRGDFLTMGTMAWPASVPGPLERGSPWHTVVIALLATLLVVVPLFVLSAFVSRGNKPGISHVFRAALIGCTSWMPVVLVPPLVILYFISPSMLFEHAGAATTWITGLAAFIFMMMLETSQVAVQNKRRGRDGFLAYLFATLITIAAAVLILESMGAFG